METWTIEPSVDRDESSQSFMRVDNRSPRSVKCDCVNDVCAWFFFLFFFSRRPFAPPVSQAGCKSTAGLLLLKREGKRVWLSRTNSSPRDSRDIIITLLNLESSTVVRDARNSRSHGRQFGGRTALTLYHYACPFDRGGDYELPPPALICGRPRYWCTTFRMLQS